MKIISTPIVKHECSKQRSTPSMDTVGQCECGQYCQVWLSYNEFPFCRNISARKARRVTAKYRKDMATPTEVESAAFKAITDYTVRVKIDLDSLTANRCAREAARWVQS